MEKLQISDTFYCLETKDEAEKLISTVVFRLENGMYEAFSSYFPINNGNVIGFATGNNDEQAVILSLKDFGKEMKLAHKLNAVEKKETTDYYG